jgi:origin recognition complex subunit 1
MKPTPAEMLTVLESLVAARAVVFEQTAVAARKAFGDRRVILNVEQSEVERVLADVGGSTWKNLLSA